MTLPGNALVVDGEDGRTMAVVEDGDEVIVSLSLSLQQRIDIRLRSPQIHQLIDWLVDRHPDGKV